MSVYFVCVWFVFMVHSVGCALCVDKTVKRTLPVLWYKVHLGTDMSHLQNVCGTLGDVDL